MGDYAKGNLKYGPVEITINGAKPGYQRANAVVRRVPKVFLIEDIRGVPIDAWVASEYLVVEVDFMELSQANLGLFFPTATQTGSLIEYKESDLGKLVDRVGTVIVESGLQDWYAVLTDAIFVADEAEIVGDDEKGIWHLKGKFISGIVENGGTIFKIGPKTDTTGPSVSAIDPADAATDVPVDKTIEITFDETLMESTVTTDNFLLIKEDDETQVTVTVSYDAATNKVSMNPTSNLANNTEYMVVVLKNVCDVNGNRMSANFYSGFTTAA